MIYLAEKKSPNPVMISEIANAYNIPQHFLAKIAQTLVKHHLLTTIRGRKGGVMLGKPASEIYLKQVVEALDGPDATDDRCVIGLDYCADDVPCPLHHRWIVIREQIIDMLEKEDLSDLADRTLKKRETMHAKGFRDLVGELKSGTST